MGFLSKTINKSHNGISREIGYFLDIQSEVKSFALREDDKNVVDIDGSVEILPSMLKGGELPFKIGKLTGDFICYCKEFKQSVIPEHVGGNIMFKNRLLGENTIRTKFKIGDSVVFLAKDRPRYGSVKEIIINIAYDEAMEIKEDISYEINIQGKFVVPEKDAFASTEEMRSRMLQKTNGIPKNSYFKFNIQHTLGDEVWMIWEDKIVNRPIAAIDIKVRESSIEESIIEDSIMEDKGYSVFPTYKVKIDGELHPIKIFWDSQKACLEAL